MSVVGRAQSERLQNHQLTRCIRQMVLTSKHMRDTHVRIVHRIRKEKCGAPIGTPDHEVTDVVGQETLCAVNKIYKLDTASVWDPEAAGRRYALEWLHL